MNETFAQGVATISLVGVSAGLSLAVLTARQALPVRLGVDVLRLAVTAGTVLVMQATTGVATPAGVTAAAVIAGGLFGLAQGRTLQIDDRDGRLYARKSVLAILVWGAGIVLMQTAGMASRAGAVEVGQAIAFFGVGNTLGLLGGRTTKIAELRRSVAVAAAIVGLVMSGGLFLVGGAQPALAFHGGDHPGCVADGTGGYYCGPQAAPEPAPVAPPAPPSASPPTTRPAARSRASTTTTVDDGAAFCRSNGFEPDRDGDGLCDLKPGAGDEYCRSNGFEPDRDGDGLCDLKRGAGDDYCRSKGLDPDRNGDNVCDLSAGRGDEFCTANGFAPDADGDGVCDIPDDVANDYCTANGFAPDADGDGVCDLPGDEADQFCVANGFAPDADGDGVCDIPDDEGAAYCRANGFAPDADGDGVCDLPITTASVTTAPVDPSGDDARTVDPDENAAQSAAGSAGAAALGLTGLAETLGRNGNGGSGRGGRRRDDDDDGGAGGPDIDGAIDRGMDTFTEIDLGGTKDGDPAEGGGIWVDADGDGTPETIATDIDGDGTPEFVSDTDGDGVADTVFVDSDGDGEIDTAIDYNPSRPPSAAAPKDPETGTRDSSGPTTPMHRSTAEATGTSDNLDDPRLQGPAVVFHDDHIAWLREIEAANRDATPQEIIARLHELDYPADVDRTLPGSDVRIFEHGPETNKSDRVEIPTKHRPKFVIGPNGERLDIAHTYAAPRSDFNRSVAESLKRDFFRWANTHGGDSWQEVMHAPEASWAAGQPTWAHQPPDQRRGNTVGEWLSDFYRDPKNKDVPVSEAMRQVYRRLDIEPLNSKGEPGGVDL